MIESLIEGQLWKVDRYFEPSRFRDIRNMYRKSRIDMSMTYDDRILTPWQNSPELQEIVVAEQARIEDIVKQKLTPQVAYVSIDLSGSAIMMHRLHPDIFVQVQIALCDKRCSSMDFAFCTDQSINEKSELDYKPIRRISTYDSVSVEYAPNVASVYLNQPRSFVGMLGRVPENSIREVLVLSYMRLN